MTPRKKTEGEGRQLSPEQAAAKFWLSVLVDLKNRGVADVFFVV